MMTGELDTISRQKLSHQVESRLLGWVRSGRCPPGSSLPSERKLMEIFDVGRPAVREALQSLERKGLIAINHGELARVMAPTPEDVLGQASDIARHLLATSPNTLEHLKEARLLFETGMVAIVARKATKADVANLNAALAAQAEAAVHRLDRFLKKDMEFHRAIASIAGNPIYVAISQAIFDWLERFHVDLVRLPGAEKLTLREHKRIIERIAAHDEEGAIRAMTGHLTRANKLYGKLMQTARRASLEASDVPPTPIQKR